MKQLITMKRLLRTTYSGFAIALSGVASHASTNVFDFNSDPSGILTTITRGGDNATLIALAGVWFPTNGSPLEAGVADQSTNGYFAITQTTPDASFTAHGMRSKIVFDDFDGGFIVSGFTFACDVRIGGGTATPADGFSLNYARSTDPAILADTYGSGPNGNPANAPEEGTQTGLVISFDAFANSGSDTIGLTIKVDNTVLTNVQLPTLNGACSNPTSLQTGPNVPPAVSNLCWQPLSVTLTPEDVKTL